ncbi:MAG TPA: hypothetical protein PLE19_03930 [Planctomycetota bacterium]|nr:hypothetical protein [Planctomycetota bacterium]HRR78551.1 hypothetical protein [Planctomycetota bacterium]
MGAESGDGGLVVGGDAGGGVLVGELVEVLLGLGPVLALDAGAGVLEAQGGVALEGGGRRCRVLGAGGCGRGNWRLRIADCGLGSGAGKGDEDHDGEENGRGDAAEEEDTA